MAIYHLHVKNISRADGRSVVAAAAYRAGETLANEREERLSDFSGRRCVLHSEILAPDQAPAFMRDRTKLWNAVEAVERRKDARLAKEIEFALPRELSPKDWIDLAQRFAGRYCSQGYVVDFAVHEDGSGNNPHVHMLLTTRAITPEGFGAKRREMDRPAFVAEARRLWEELANTALTERCLTPIDRRSHRERGIAERPSRHRGLRERDERRRGAPELSEQEVERMTRETKQPEPKLEEQAPEEPGHWWQARDEAAEPDEPDAGRRWWQQEATPDEFVLSEAERAEYEAHLDERRAAQPDPEPDPDGRPITPQELWGAQEKVHEEREQE